MSKIKTLLKNEFINGQTKFDWTFLAIGIILQIIAIVFTCLNPEGMNTSQIVWTSISGLTGIISVVLCAQGKISFYIFGFIQLFSYVFAVAIPNALWGEVGENVYYFITMLIGMVIWFKNYGKTKEDSIQIKSKKFKAKGWIITISILVAITIALGFMLTYMHEWKIFDWVTHGKPDPQPWLDSITTTAPFIAQILLMLGYREQWFFWIIEDICSLIMFIVLGNWIMVAQYLFWTINCIYGWLKWTKSYDTNLERV